MASPLASMAPLRLRRSVPIDPGVAIGHVHLKVADLDRALAFYCGVLGFELIQRYGTQAAFISAGGYHHHIGLNTWESKGGSPPPPGTTGLYHVAILYPTRAALADALDRLAEAGMPLDGASDHGVSEALYLRDPGPERRRALLGSTARSSGRRPRRRTADGHTSASTSRICLRKPRGLTISGNLVQLYAWRTSGKDSDMWNEFKQFALRGNVVDLAIGIIIGAAFGRIVDSLVGDIFMPIIGAVTGGLDFSNYFTPFRATSPLRRSTRPRTRARFSPGAISSPSPSTSSSSPGFCFSWSRP